MHISVNWSPFRCFICSHLIFLLGPAERKGALSRKPTRPLHSLAKSGNPGGQDRRRQTWGGGGRAEGGPPAPPPAPTVSLFCCCCCCCWWWLPQEVAREPAVRRPFVVRWDKVRRFGDRPVIRLIQILAPELGGALCFFCGRGSGCHKSAKSIKGEMHFRSRYR